MKIFKGLVALSILLITNVSFAETKVIELKSDKAVYAVGEVPVLQATVLTKPDSSDFQFDITAKLNNADIATSRVTDFQMFSAPKNLAVGSYSWTVTLVIQDASYAKDLKTTIRYYENQILDLDAQIAVETDPAALAVLQGKRADAVQIKTAAASELQSIRTAVLQPVTLTFSVQ